LYFSQTGEYQLAFRQLAKVVGNFANWRIHYGETKSLLANFTREIRQIGGIPHDIRQLANTLWRNKKFIGEFHTRDSPIGECRGEFRQWRI